MFKSTSPKAGLGLAVNTVYFNLCAATFSIGLLGARK